MVCHPVYVLIAGERRLKLNVLCWHTQSEVHKEVVS